jgi:hypothetical protein
MEYKEILEHIAPCGLNCNKCVANSKGKIKEHCSELLNLLGNFKNFAERFSTHQEVYKNYPAFEEMLKHFDKAECNGCRIEGKCIFKSCGVAPCAKEKKVDFCFQCNEFPCDKTNFPPPLYERWIKMNNHMKEIGVEAYAEESKQKPRYL